MPMYQVIRFARDNSGDWAEVNPVLSEGEPGYELDTGKMKIGDGYSRWLDLNYYGFAGPVGPGVSDEAVLAHINSVTPHPIYDDGPSLVLLYQNAKV